MCATLITDSLSHNFQPICHPICYTICQYPELPWQVISIKETDMLDDILDREGDRKSEAVRIIELLVG